MKKYVFFIVLTCLLASTRCHAQYAESLHFSPFSGRVVTSSGLEVGPSEFSNYLDDGAAAMCSFAYDRYKFSSYAALTSVAVFGVGYGAGTVIALKSLVDVFRPNSEISPLIGPLYAFGILGFYSTVGFSGSAILNMFRVEHACDYRYFMEVYEPDPQHVARLMRSHKAFKVCTTASTAIFGASALTLSLMYAFPSFGENDDLHGGLILTALSSGLIASACSFGLLRTERNIYNLTGKYPVPGQDPLASLSFGPTPSGIGLSLKF